MRVCAFLIVLAVETSALVWVVGRDACGGLPAARRAQDNRELVGALELTDLALWTEARYTRHPSQADGFAAFQDAPGAPDHFPAGTWVPPPPGRGIADVTRHAP